VIVRLTQIDGKLPNLALMRLAYYHHSRRDRVVFSRSPYRQSGEPRYDRVYGSTIFNFSKTRTDRFLQEFPEAAIGGTGTEEWHTLEQHIQGIEDEYDYSIYPEFDNSIGFLQRGCRLKCKFCVVPRKEGRPQAVKTVRQLWRGEPYPKRLHLLDNDFFGVDSWEDNIEEIREGGFRVCLTQGINVRLITDEAAAALAKIEYRDTKFRQRRLYTAWDSLGSEKIFFRGIDRLEAAGIPTKHVMAYMLIGYDPKETWEAIQYRFYRMVDRGILPYPMVYDNARKDLKDFQRWAVTGLYRRLPFRDYRPPRKSGWTPSDVAPPPWMDLL